MTIEINPYTIDWPEYVTETHVHLGGSVPLYRLWESAVERGIRGLGRGYDEFLELVKIKKEKVKDLDSYIKIFDTVELIQSGPTSVRESVIISAHRAFRTGGMLHIGPGGEGSSTEPLFRIGKFELRMNPMKRTGAVFLKGQHAGLYDVDRIIKAAAETAQDLDIGFQNKLKVGLIFCFGRDMTFEANKILAEKTAAWKEKTDKVIGIDLAGPESVNSLEDPKKLAEMAELYNIVGNINKTIHVGETKHVSLDTFIKTIEALNPNRIGHPIVAFKEYRDKGDDRGLKLMQERKIVCEFCVQSNLITRAVETIEDYKFIINTADEFDIPYTFSTDAPSLQGTTLAEELVLILKAGAATPERILRALKVADDTSFLNN